MSASYCNIYEPVFYNITILLYSRWSSFMGEASSLLLLCFMSAIQTELNDNGVFNMFRVKSIVCLCVCVCARRRHALLCKLTWKRCQKGGAGQLVFNVWQLKGQKLCTITKLVQCTPKSAELMEDVVRDSMKYSWSTYTPKHEKEIIVNMFFH